MEYNNFLSECNCKNLRFNFKTYLKPKDWLVRTCSCSFCLKYPHHVYCSDNNGSVEFYIKNISELRIYQHGTKTADFLICNNCHSYMGAVMQSDKGLFAVINIQDLNNKLALPKPYKLKWKDEKTDDRVSRRHDTWTPVIKYFDKEF